MAKKNRILVIEDEPGLREGIKAILQKSGYEVILASDGKEGLDMARKESPDLIILDLMMPKIDGYKVCRLLKFDSRYKQIPIIIFTVRAEKEDETMAYSAGADAYITKTLEPKVLLDKIEELLKKISREKESKNGSTPISRSRIIEPGASLV